MADLDHQNIVKYYGSWEEQYPTGWRKENDKQMIAGYSSKSSMFISSTTAGWSRKLEANSGVSNYGHNNRSTTCSETDCSSCPSCTSRTSGSSTSQEEMTESYLFIQMELCRDDNLANWIEKRDPAMNVVHLFKQILTAVAYLHEKVRAIKRFMFLSNLLNDECRLLNSNYQEIGAQRFETFQRFLRYGWHR